MFLQETLRPKTRTTTSPSEMDPPSQHSWLGRAWDGLLTVLLLMLVGLYGAVYLIVVVFGLIFMFVWFLRFWGWT
jgi:hypothetical protein